MSNIKRFMDALNSGLMTVADIRKLEGRMGHTRILWDVVAFIVTVDAEGPGSIAFDAMPYGDSARFPQEVNDVVGAWSLARRETFTRLLLDGFGTKEWPEIRKIVEGLET